MEGCFWWGLGGLGGGSGGNISIKPCLFANNRLVTIGHLTSVLLKLKLV